MNPLIFILLALGGSAVFGSVKIVNEKNQYLVESLGSYKKTLEPGLNFVTPFIDKIVYRETIREKVLDVPPQSCITRDNVSISVDAVVYWRIVDMYKAYYKVENLQSAMVNLVLTQIRSEMGKLELDETFTARTEINELLLRELDISTDPWGVKVTRVELRDIMPSKAVQDSMELQMAAERKKRAAILTSEGEREAAVNSAQGRAQSQVLEAEAQKKAAILQAEAEKEAIIMRAEAKRQEEVMRAQAAAQAMQIVAQQLKGSAAAGEALQFILAQQYLEMGQTIGRSGSSKVMFLDPRNMMSTLEGMKSVIGNQADLTALDFDPDQRDRHQAS
ncbi:SPFH/Band 7/PHB domain protein [Synechococcus moorigangaii CMS01]|nr:SPFH/Band 7/PHB domain protein [Synechococcus moorigangaii CMS01]